MELNSPDIFASAFAEGMTPDPLLTVSEWASRHRVLSSRASAEPGLWRNERTPYLTEIMDCLSSTSGVEEVRVMKGAQVGFTEGGNNWIGYIISGNASAPTLMVLPTVEMAKRSSKQRIQPLIEESPALRERVKPARERDSGNTTLMKEFPGGVLVMTGANSAVGLRSMSAKNLFLDEVDAYPGDADGEGDPVELARARTRTFSRRKILIGSTPTISGRSRIESLFLEGDQRYFHVPCPHCGTFQKLQWSGLRWRDNDPRTAHYVCSECQGKIEEQHKTAMLAHGEWRPENTDCDPRLRSYHLSSLYSPVGWLSWADTVKMWLDSQKSQDKLRTFINTILGETWKDREGEAPAWEKLFRRRETYRIGMVPRGPVFLVIGCDVQKDRVEYEVVGYGIDRSSWSIEYGAIPGDTSSTDSPVWRDLDKLLTREWEGEDGRRFGARLLAIDTGYNTQVVYNWARKYPSNRVVAIKGSDTLATIVGMPKSVDVTLGGKSIRRGLRLWSVGVSIAKTELYGWLNLEPPLREGDAFPAGYCHFPEYDEEYFKMLTAEVLTARYHKGFRRYEFEKIRERNEALDARVYARACAAIIGMDRMSENAWRALDVNHNGLWPGEDREGDALDVTPAPTSAQTPPTGGTPQAPPPAPRPRSEILAGRRRSSFW